MINVLIVDDEHLLRKHIRCSIDWPALDMQVIGEARDGNGALEIIHLERPDIVLTDIRMPDMNGIQLAKSLRDSYPDIIVIIITGYGEFEYAKEAVDANVFSYLLKPVNEKEYTQALLKAREKVLEKKNRRSIICRIEQYQNSQSRSYNLKRIILEPHSAQEIRELLQNARVDIFELNLCVIVIKWETLGHSMADAQYREASRDKLEAQLNTQVLTGVNCVVFENNPDELVVICNIDAAQQKSIAVKMEHFCISLEVTKVLKMYAGISCVADKYECLQSLYLQAKKAQKSIFVLANCKVLIYSDEESHSMGLLSQYFDSNELMNYLRRNDVDLVRGHIESIMDGMAAQRATKETCIFVSLMLLSVLNKYLVENNCALEYRTNELVEIVSNKATLAELKVFVLMLFERSMEELAVNIKRIPHEKVTQAQQYIAAHYSDPNLSLNSVARMLFINASYLCSLFKRETDVTIVEYIKNYRLNIAKQMLDEKTDVTISEVASAVGYSDEYYFMRCFKKEYGMSPKTYKQIKKL